ncbi:MAG: Flp family type IVb pilin [Hyphomicrobium sp.]
MCKFGGMKAIQRFINDESGVTSIEYALIAVLVAAGIVSSLYGVRGALNDGFSSISVEFQAAV